MPAATPTTEHPILFKGPMVHAILDRGKPKTQTRRPLKVQPPCSCGVTPEEMSATTSEGWQTLGHSGQWWCPCCTGDWRPHCPLGVPGDLLWVRHAHWFKPASDLCAERVWDDFTWMMRSREGDDGVVTQSEFEDLSNFVSRPSIHLSRWACRIILTVLEVRIERLNDITEADAIAEGFTSRAAFLASFRTLYSLPDNANPWLWAITFKRKREA